MRSWELAAVVANALTLTVFAIPPLRRNRWLSRLPVLGAIVALLQAVLEGARWQLVPTYCLAAAFLFVWLWRLFRGPGRRAGFRALVAAGLGLAVVVLLVSVAAPVALPVFRFPTPSGPYAIGTSTYHWVDTGRRELFSPDPAAKRELMAQLWYPAAEDASSQRAPYAADAGALSAGLTRSLSASGILRLPSSTFDYFAYVRTNAIPNAPIARDRASYPVLIYLTGLSGWSSANMLQIQELVSHGYVVVGLDQPYTAAAVTLPDGRVVPGLPRPEVQPLIDQSVAPSTPAPRLDGLPLAGGIIPYLARDVGFALDRLSAVDEADPRHVLTGRLDLAEAGVFGVSLGAITAGQACEEDRRLKACLMMDAAMPVDVARSGLAQPAMWVTRDAATMRLERERAGGWTEKDIRQTLGTMQSAFRRSAPHSSYYLTIPGLFHTDFTDAPLWTPLAAPLGLSGPAGAQAPDILNAYTLAFFGKALGGERSPLLDGTSRPYPEATVTSN